MKIQYPPNINRETKFIKRTKKKVLQYAYDPMPPSYNDLKIWDIVAVKRLTNKFDYIGEITLMTRTQGSKIRILVDGVEYNIKDIRKCYPAI